MAYYSVRVENKGKAAKDRAGYIFPPYSSVEIVVKDKDLPQIRACEGLTMTILSVSVRPFGDKGPIQNAPAPTPLGEPVEAIPDQEPDSVVPWSQWMMDPQIRNPLSPSPGRQSPQERRTKAAGPNADEGPTDHGVTRWQTPRITAPQTR